MKISGFTIVRNGELFAYPFKEAIQSILPLCHEMIVNVGHSDDETLEAVRSIKDEKMKIFESNWDMSLKGGTVLSTETNKAMARCSGDWLVYVQADEVIHEKFHDVIAREMEQNFRRKEVEGLRFKYKHFYGSYDFYQDNFRKWYVKEVRVIRNTPDILSWGDAMDFRHHDGSKLNARDIDAEIYHYGWVRPPEVLIHKRREFEKLYHDDEVAEKNIAGFQNYDDLGNLRKFTDTHPRVMHERVSLSKWDFDPRIEEQNPEWLRKLLIFLHPVTKRLKKLKGVDQAAN